MLDDGAVPGGEGGFIEGASDEAEDGLCGGLLGSGEAKTVQSKAFKWLARRVSSLRAHL